MPWLQLIAVWGVAQSSWALSRLVAGLLAQQAPAPAPLQDRVNEVARALQNRPRLKNMSEKQRENLVSFITGNMLFVMLHEMGHGAVNEFNIPITGREEDSADNFAIINLLPWGISFIFRLLPAAVLRAG